ncbi:MAG: hypothetical protein V3V16_04055 [Melioribacteraceae bacterium]
MKNLIRIIFVTLLISVAACTEPSDIVFERNATLIWTGEYEVDGCGFFIKVDSVQYKANSESVISNIYKEKDSTNVVIQYKNLHFDKEYYCVDLPKVQTIGVIQIISLEEN